MKNYEMNSIYKIIRNIINKQIKEITGHDFRSIRLNYDNTTAQIITQNEPDEWERTNENNIFFSKM